MKFQIAPLTRRTIISSISLYGNELCLGPRFVGIGCPACLPRSKALCHLRTKRRLNTFEWKPLKLESWEAVARGGEREICCAIQTSATVVKCKISRAPKSTVLKLVICLWQPQQGDNYSPSFKGSILRNFVERCHRRLGSLFCNAPFRSGRSKIGQSLGA